MSAATKEEWKRLGIGRKIRSLRDEKRIGLAEMAANTGVQEVLLQQIEADVVAPTVATLLNISKLLGVGVDYFFTEQMLLGDVEVVRKDERRVISAPDHKRNAPLIYSYESLAYQMAAKHMEPFLVEFAPHVPDAEAVPQSHAGEEFLFILKGEVEFVSQEKRVVLREGDSLYFHSKIPHVLRAVGHGKAKAVAVLYPYEN
jgi:transcriptional regulator with XRE-family HTH domain